MLELTFFTTNSTKLAHARYVAEGRYIRIKGFKQRTYHADYFEPRLTSREEILKASYKSAKRQLAKAGLSEASHLFFLEDTSIRIDAFSTEQIEIPGVDVKYWMQDQTFSKLDTELKSESNNRNVTVRSDVLLHVPDVYRKSWGIDSEYLVFTGMQHGKVIEQETDFHSNLVYPWLDNRSFNKWFQPEGCSGPLGSLPIEIADSVDFRRNSFEQLYNFLKNNRLCEKPSTQMRFSLDRKPNIVLCGYTCSGKTTASQYLARKFGYLHIEASDFMYLSYFYRHGSEDPVPIGDFAESALKQKPTIAAEKVVDYLVENISEPAVISGFRSQNEIEYLREKMDDFGKQFSHRFVEANEQIRFTRLQKRGRPGDNLTIDKFRHRDLQQQRMGLDQIRVSPDVSLLENIGGLTEYWLALDRLVGDDDSREIDLAQSLESLKTVSEVKLEDSILIALLSVWKDDEAREFYSTTEVASLISLVFPSLRPKHKDNVSRYFNQDFYSYYEISSKSDSAVRKYRLSNTGYGKAILTLRKKF